MNTTHDPVTFEILQANVRLLAENERLESERQRLLELDRLKTEFLARISHDLRTPLNSIIGFSDLMLAESGSTKASKSHSDFLSAINRNGHALLAMINDLLDLSTIESGQLHMRREWVRLSVIVADLRAATEAVLIERSIRAVWPSEEELAGKLALVDRRRLVQALTNLIDNARKYVPAGGHIQVTMEASSTESRFSVADDGPGVPADEQERIFRPYYQRSGSTAGALVGVGLGLAIVKGIVERHGGRITLDSGIGKGCCFRLSIPHVVEPQSAKGHQS